MLSFPITQIVGQKLKSLRIQAGFTEPEICEKLQMNPGDFRKLERGMTELPLWRLAEITNVLDIELHDLLKKDGSSDHTELKNVLELFVRVNAEQAKEIMRLQRKVIELYNSFGGA